MSPLPSTTLNTVNIEINEHLTLIDTPGLVDSGSILNQIDQLVKEYKLNDNAISLTGFSSSGTYVYKLVLENKENLQRRIR